MPLGITMSAAPSLSMAYAEAAEPQTHYTRRATGPAHRDVATDAKSNDCFATVDPDI